MEWQIDQVLNRDQRTTRTLQQFQQDDCCLNCKKSQSKEASINNHANRITAASSADCASNLRAARNSSLFVFPNCHCHNQYFLKNERLLYQTEVPCECGKGVNYGPETNQMTSIRFKSCLKQLCNLLLITLVSLLILPGIRAIPTSTSSRSSSVPQITQMAGQDESALLKSLVPAYRATCSALGAARELKAYYLNLKPANVEKIYEHTMLSGLPTYLEQDNTREQVARDLAAKPLKTAFLDMLRDIRIIHGAYNEIADNFENHPIKDLHGANESNFKDRYSAMRGLLANIQDDLTEVLFDKYNAKDEVVPARIITAEAMNERSETRRMDIDWLVLRSLVEVLAYSSKLFEHFQVPSQ